jgi:hypothetical protein
MGSNLQLSALAKKVRRFLNVLASYMILSCCVLIVFNTSAPHQLVLNGVHSARSDSANFGGQDILHHSTCFNKNNEECILLCCLTFRHFEVILLQKHHFKVRNFASLRPQELGRRMSPMLARTARKRTPVAAILDPVLNVLYPISRYVIFYVLDRFSN